MAKYDKTRFYWLQLKEDFFEDDAINWLEEQEPNGRDYAYFYLKLCLKSLKSNGVLVREVGNILIPYDNKKLAELTKMDFDTVCVAMELLKKIGLVDILDDGEIYLTQLENLIGSTSRGAFKKQLQISRRNGQKSIGWNESGNNSTKDKDKVKDKDKDKIDKLYNYYENEIRASLTPHQYEIMDSYLDIFDPEVIKVAIDKTTNMGVNNFSYMEGILKNWKQKGLTTLEQVKGERKELEESDIDYELIDSIDREMNEIYGITDS